MAYGVGMLVFEFANDEGSRAEDRGFPYSEAADMPSPSPFQHPNTSIAPTAERWVCAGRMRSAKVPKGKEGMCVVGKSYDVPPM